MVADIITGDMPTNETTKFCTYCVVRHACPKFQPVGDSGRVSLLDMRRIETVSSLAGVIGESDA
jgi:hypothetical protein